LREITRADVFAVQLLDILDRWVGSRWRHYGHDNPTNTSTSPFLPNGWSALNSPLYDLGKELLRPCGGEQSTSPTAAKITMFLSWLMF